jgi:hypothetical protein
VKRRQAAQEQLLMDALAHWLAASDFDIRQFMSSVPDAIGFAKFLDQIRATNCFGKPAFRQTVAQLLKQMASDPELGQQACSLVQQLKEPEMFQLACVFHKIRLHAVERDMVNGHYDGRLADIVLYLRRKFRAGEINRYATNLLLPQFKQIQEQKNKLWGSIAEKLSDKLDLGVDMADVGREITEWVPDVIQISCIIPQTIMKQENENFARYLAVHDSPHVHLLKRASPQIAAIMDKTSDANGNVLSGDALTSMHLQDLKDYFSSTGQPDLTLPVWEPVGDPNAFKIENMHRLDTTGRAAKFNGPADCAQQ